MDPSWIGSAEHKEVLCRVFIDSHLPFEPADVAWPDLDGATRDRLGELPIWEEAVKSEAQTALTVLTMGQAEPDPLVGEAIRLQGYEEARHAELLDRLTRRYGIPVPAHQPVRPRRLEWAFLRVGYGECFDSFFAFGLFALARDSGFVPPALVKLFEPVMQEEARHILFHVNWVAYRQAQMPYAQRPAYVFRRGLAAWLQLASRVRTAVQVKGATRRDQENFTMAAYGEFGEVSPRAFLETCLREYAARLEPYDRRLLRPVFVPRLARAALGRLA